MCGLECAGMGMQLRVCVRLLEEWGILKLGSKEKVGRGAVGQ